MNFDKWYESEGRNMADAGCSPQIVARAAWFVATNVELKACVAICDSLSSSNELSREERAGAGECLEAIKLRGSE